MKRFKTRSTAAVGLLVGALALAGCGGGSDAGSGSSESADAPTGLLSGSEFKLCTYPEYAPMEYFKNGTGGSIVGFDVDLARAVGDAWGIKTVVQNTAFDGLIPGLGAKRCDAVLSGLYISDERKKVAAAVPYLLTGSAIAARAGTASQITGPESLSGKRIAVQSGASFVTVLKRLNATLEGEGKPPVKIVQYPQTPLAVGAVLSGKADALMETDIAVADIVSKNDGELQGLDSVFPPDQIFGAYFSKSSGLADAFSQELGALLRNGTLGKLAQKHGLSEEKLDVSKGN